jgi:hypothetical protein
MITAPKQKGEKTMRLADSEAFELLLINYMNNPCISEESKYLLDVVLNMAKANPTIEGVPVVRCKDCKHAKTLFVGDLTGKKVLQCNAWHAYINPSMYDYCSRGEKRESEEQ